MTDPFHTEKSGGIVGKRSNTVLKDVEEINMKELSVILPNQLFEDISILNKKFPIYLIEEFLFFKNYNFHKQKLVFHRSSMKCYEKYLIKNGYTVSYIESKNELSDIRYFINNIDKEINNIHIIEPNDYLIEKRLVRECNKNNIKLNIYDSPAFISSKDDLKSFFKEDKVKFFQTSFYKAQRKKFNILLSNGDPKGGKWTYDDENRLKYPKDKKTPHIEYPVSDNDHSKAIKYVNENFERNIGVINRDIIYPFTFNSAKKWFENFLNKRFKEFGPYEDAILKEESILNHSLLSPLLNSGLLSPKYIVNESLLFYKKNNIPINSCEGFIRQIIGWREFIRGIYTVKGSYERTKNYWNFTRKIPRSFYEGNTGIEPVDDTIKKVIKSAYNHHIERLMIIGNFMLLCEFDPDEVYRWFMEFYIDAYDWVMVPNVYGMSQFADGGLMSTKPYVSGSSYILKMSNYKKSEWCNVWDALFWRFLHKQRDFFSKNPRMRMLVSTYDKMDKSKKDILSKTAKNYLENLK